MFSSFWRGWLMGTNVSPSQRHLWARQQPSAKCADRLSVRGLPGLGSSHGAMLQPAKQLRLPAGSCQGERGIHLHIRAGFLGLFWVFNNPLAEAYWFRVMLPGLKGNMGQGPA